MIELKNIAYVMAGSAFGGALRYLVSLFFAAQQWNKLPWATFIINVTGCFLIGIIYALVEKSASGTHQLRLLLATGFCGGFTTFSAFALENFTLFKEQAVFTAVIYICLSVVLGIGATFLGITLFK